MATKRPVDSDSTVLAPRPEMTDDTGNVEEVDSGMVFEDELDELVTTTSGRKPEHRQRDRTSDISLIEAKSEMAQGPAGASSFEGFDSRRVTSFGDGALMDDETANPPTEILRLAFSDPGSDPITDEPEAPAIVKKWKMGGEEQRPGVFTLPPAEQGGGTRVDAIPGAMGKATPLDVDELRRTLEEAEKLMKTVKSQLSGMDIESRGTNAQVAAALHRLGEALAMLKR